MRKIELAQIPNMDSLSDWHSRGRTTRVKSYIQFVFFHKALTIEPTDVDILANKREALVKLGRYNESIPLKF